MWEKPVNPNNVLPGTPQHQMALSAIITYYRLDPRVLEVVVFGSLGRGDWDQHSDLDLDIILADGARVEVIPEIDKLCAFLAALGESAALIIPDGSEAADVVCASLLQLSLRYHPLATTKPDIVASMRPLLGRLSLQTIREAGLANPARPRPPLMEQLDRCLRYAAVALVAAQRHQVWAGVEVLHRMRHLLMEIFSRTHQGERTYQAFAAQAPSALQDQLGAALPQYSPGSVQASLASLLETLATNLDEFSAGQLSLDQTQAALLERIRRELAQISG